MNFREKKTHLIEKKKRERIEYKLKNEDNAERIWNLTEVRPSKLRED